MYPCNSYEWYTRYNLKRDDVAATLSNKVVASRFHIVLSVGTLKGRSPQVPVLSTASKLQGLHGGNAFIGSPLWRLISKLLLVYSTNVPREEDAHVQNGSPERKLVSK